MFLKYKMLLFSCFFSLSCWGQQSSLDVVNPESPWKFGHSTIEEAQFTIQPRGVYMEIGMYLTFSARAAKYISYNNRDTINYEQSLVDLESILSFDLPIGSMVTDSWLWIYEEVIQADIEERWHATRVYEDIVGYRRDPSLLTKNNWSYYQGDKSEDRYNLRVYPLQPDSTRRVKITYLTPGNWQDGNVSVSLPTNILDASKIPVENITIQCFLNNNFSNPRIEQLPSRFFTPASHETLGDHFLINLPNKEMENGLDIIFDIPMKDGIFLSRYEEPERDYYQLVVLPEKALFNRASPPRKIAVLLDYDSSKTTLSKEVLMSTLQEQLKTNLNHQDSFCLIFAGQNGIEWINSKWLSADEQSIPVVFQLLEETYTLSEVSHLPQLLDKGIDFIKNNGGDGSLLLLSCADQFQETTDIDEFIANLTPKLSTISTSIHVADYQNKDLHGNYYYEMEENDLSSYLEFYHYGNEYLYIQLNELTGGNTKVLREQNNLSNLLFSSFQAISSVHEVEDIKISKSEGSCFSQFKLPEPTFKDATTPFVQVGKCVGNFPYTIDISARVDNQNITKSIVVDESYMNGGTQNHITSWAGNYICQQELIRPYHGLHQGIVEHIIEWSLRHRVLSLYTAFLALEPAEGGYVCEECVDETNLPQLITDFSGNIQDNGENEVELPNVNLSNPVRGEEFSLPDGDSIITATKEVYLDSLFQIVASPNPFKEQTIINVQLNQTITTSNLTASIFDINGREVKSFSINHFNKDSDLSFYWDGANTQSQQLAAGVYIFTIRSNVGQRSYKLIRME